MLPQKALPPHCKVAALQTVAIPLTARPFAAPHLLFYSRPPPRPSRLSLIPLSTFIPLVLLHNRVFLFVAPLRDLTSSVLLFQVRWIP